VGKVSTWSGSAGDAAPFFKEALAIEPKNAQAMLGLALVAAEKFEQGAVKMAERR